jgi:hypothetical protein
MDKMEVLISEFYQSEKIKIISEGTFGFKAVEFFLLTFFTLKKVRSGKLYLFKRKLILQDLSIDIEIFKQSWQEDRNKELLLN